MYSVVHCELKQVLCILYVLCVFIRSQALFLNAQVFVFGVLEDLEVVWPAILM